MNKKQKFQVARVGLALLILITVYVINLTDLKLALCAAAYLIVGYDVLWSAVRNILRGQVFDENFLMGIASMGAFLIGEYPEAVAVVMFYQVGDIFEQIAVGKSRRSIAALMDIRPDYAVVLSDGNEYRLSPEEVAVGETIIIRPGDRIPLDGVILDGTTSVNTSSITGESLPADKTPGDEVISGCVNLTGVITVKVKSEYGESTVYKILELVENSAENKAKSESFITRFARYYTPCVAAAAFLLAVIAPLFFGQSWSEWINRALIFLVVSCPCALVISVPLSFFGGIGGASKQGILIKGSNYLETLAKVDTVVFDKTGTLTKGNFAVTAVQPVSVSRQELLSIAALAESYSNHPIAESIVAAHGDEIDKSRIGQVTEYAGKGVKALIDGKPVYVGNGQLMDSVNANWQQCNKLGSVVHVAMGSEYMGHIVISDQVKPDAKKAISALKALGVKKTVMLTGDNKTVGESVASDLGIDEVYAELLPGNKVKAVERILSKKRRKGRLAFVGDGINDAPVLTRADIGIAMGAVGSDAAIEAADVVLMDDKPSKVADAISRARFTMRIVWENIIFSLGVKAAVLVLGAIGLAGMWLAVFADVGVLIIAIMNTMRTLKK